MSKVRLNRRARRAIDPEVLRRATEAQRRRTWGDLIVRAVVADAEGRPHAAASLRTEAKRVMR